MIFWLRRMYRVVKTKTRINKSMVIQAFLLVCKNYIIRIRELKADILFLLDVLLEPFV
jgi:hypothetical protein